MFLKTRRIVFMGTPEFAVPTLKAIVASGREVPWVVTQPDQRGGRGNRLLEPAVKQCALSLGLTVVQPEKLKSKIFMQELLLKKADIFVVAAYGRILHEAIIQMPRYILNVHASLLPRWRGAAPIARGILSGDKEHGVSVMKIVKELDAGDVMLMASTPIGPEETTGELTMRLAELGATSMIKALDLIENGQEVFTPQDARYVTYAHPIEKEEAKINWPASAVHIHRQVRGFAPNPGAFTFEGALRIKIHKARVTPRVSQTGVPGTLRVESGRLYVETGEGVLEILELQKEGKTRQSAASFLQGYDVTHLNRWT